MESSENYKGFCYLFGSLVIEVWLQLDSESNRTTARAVPLFAAAVLERVLSVFAHTADDTNPALPVMRNVPYFP